MKTKFIKYLEEATKTTEALDHMIYVTFPLIKDKKMMIKILIELKKSTAYCINAILQYEYFFKRIRLTRDPIMNFRIFVQKCSQEYGLTHGETEKIRELFNLIEYHKRSPMEFMRKEKLVIVAEKTKAVGIEEIKEFLKISKKLLQKTKEKLTV